MANFRIMSKVIGIITTISVNREEHNLLCMRDHVSLYSVIMDFVFGAATYSLLPVSFLVYST